MMETTMYDDSAKKLKSSMTLDFSKKNGGEFQRTTSLDTPQFPSDMNFLQISSPDLEKLLLQNNIFTGNTPTQPFASKVVTEEQEAYARGFVVALEELHRRQNQLGNNNDNSKNKSLNNSGQVTSGASFSTMSSFVSPPYSGVTATAAPKHSYQPYPLQHVNNNYITTTPLTVVNSQQQPQYSSAVKEEPQTVPSVECTPPMSPINMEEQEKIKLERKRARNRVAAAKCRTRKLERISRLEDRVHGLKEQNSGLQSTVLSLREEVARLKQAILDHSRRGCLVTLQS